MSTVIEAPTAAEAIGERIAEYQAELAHAKRLADKAEQEIIDATARLDARGAREAREARDEARDLARVMEGHILQLRYNKTLAEREELNDRLAARKSIEEQAAAARDDAAELWQELSERASLAALERSFVENDLEINRRALSALEAERAELVKQLAEN
jgi:hypothetical protein